MVTTGAASRPEAGPPASWSILPTSPRHAIINVAVLLISMLCGS
jgi:hypothetical protein